MSLDCVGTSFVSVTSLVSGNFAQKANPPPSSNGRRIGIRPAASQSPVALAAMSRRFPFDLLGNVFISIVIKIAIPTTQIAPKRTKLRHFKEASKSPRNYWYSAMLYCGLTPYISPRWVATAWRRDKDDRAGEYARRCFARCQIQSMTL
jgi:hypothetical protein